MGLDMYLTKRVYVGANYEHNQVTGRIQLKTRGEKIKINFSRVSKIIEDVAYWRKANAIHKWFVDNVQDGEDDCNDHYVDIEKLKELIQVCKDVIADHSKAEQLLPVQSGFFFGETEYNEYYFGCLQDTIDMLEPLLEESGDFYYRSSW